MRKLLFKVIGSAGYHPASNNAERRSSSLPIIETFKGSPGIPAPVLVIRGPLVSTGWRDKCAFHHKGANRQAVTNQIAKSTRNAKATARIKGLLIPANP